MFKTAIYLPAQRLDQLTEEQVKWIICHEECHYRQGDHIWSLLRILLTAVYWFHPLVWAAAYLSKKDAEISCDEKVLANSNLTQKIAYGKTLICVASRDRKLSVFYPTTAVVGTKKELKNRMRKIVEENKYKITGVIRTCIETMNKKEVQPEELEAAQGKEETDGT